MTKIAQSRGKSGEGFTRVFGNERLGLLFSKIQATVIRSGFELEETIKSSIPENIWTTLEELADITQDARTKPPVQVVFKPYRPDPENNKRSIQADFLIVDNTKRQFMLVEVKEGSVFDTKKSDGELVSLKSITSWLAQEFPYTTQYYICSFNQENKEAIVAGTKGRFTINHVMTGREFCEIVGIDYDRLREFRKLDQNENLAYFLEHLLEIAEVRSMVMKLINTDAQEDEKLES